MSKYRIIIGHSKIRRVFAALFILLCLVPVWLVPSQTYSIQWFFQSFLSANLLIFAWQRSRELQTENIVLVEDNGIWTSLNESEAGVWRVASGSRVSSFLLWIELSPQSSSAKIKNKWLWVFPDAVSQSDFRRLSRIIIRSQQRTTGPSYG